MCGVPFSTGNRATCMVFAQGFGVPWNCELAQGQEKEEGVCEGCCV